MEKRIDFENFKSNVCHLVKSQGELEFIKKMLLSDTIFELEAKKWHAECFYLLAMVDYLSRKNNIPLYNGYSELRHYKLDRIIYPAGILALYHLKKDENILKDSYDNAIPEFKRFNIVENEVENIA